MGASISIAQCKSHYNTTVDCSVTPDGSGGFQTIAGYGRGEVPPEPDIAGIGIVSVFIAVASFAFAIGVFDVTWTMTGEDSIEQLKHLLLDSVRNGTAAEKALFQSTPGNYIQGWNLYLVILIWRKHREAAENNGWRKHDNYFIKIFSGVGKISYGVYLIGGIGICGTTVVMSSLYIMSLRRWVKTSRWLELKEGGQSEEDDATSFGQLVPIILVGLTAFTFLSILSEMCAEGRKSCQTKDGYSSVTQHRKGSGRL
ncbi:hypothetical protein CaCOL14_001256 [Colletotrichum acutatum]